MANNQYMSGDYVITGIPNAFNSKTGYWISKKGNTDAYYCFTPANNADLQNQLSNFASYIALYETLHAAHDTERSFEVETPLGNMRVWAKHDVDNKDDYPGVYIDLRDLNGIKIHTLLTCVEYDSSKKHIQTVVYNANDDEPVGITIHDLTEREAADEDA